MFKDGTNLKDVLDLSISVNGEKNVTLIDYN